MGEPGENPGLTRNRDADLSAKSECPSLFWLNENPSRRAG